MIAAFHLAAFNRQASAVASGTARLISGPLAQSGDGVAGFDCLITYYCG